MRQTGKERWRLRDREVEKTIKENKERWRKMNKGIETEDEGERLRQHWTEREIKENDIWREREREEK